MTNVEKEQLLNKYLSDIVESMLDLPMNMDSFFYVIDTQISKIAFELGIAKITCEADIKADMLVPNGEKGSKVICQCSNEYDEAHSEIVDYYFKGNSYIKFTVYPVKDNIFDEVQKHWVKKLINVVFLAGGKTRLGILCNKALNTDLMTQMPNINRLFAHMGMLIAKHQINQYNAYFFNCKNFKYVNTVCGYDNGGEVLKLYCDCLRNFCIGDEIVARLGGDNFVGLIKKEHTEAFMEILKGREISIDVNGSTKTLVISAVAGIYDIKEANRIDEIMMPISFAYQAAKQILHRNFVFFDENIKNRIIENQRILSIAKKCIMAGEFQAYFQPKVNMETGKIFGAEALARWFHNGKIIPPAEFIPVLERNGDICDIDFEMLRQTCEIIKDWMSKGKEILVVSVNFSRWHLKNPNFIEKLLKIVDGYAIPHQYIEIELTETVDVEGYNTMNSLFDQLSALGFSTAIDDFGTGYSSLNMLVKSNVDIIKIDKSFVDEIENEKSDNERNLLRHIVNIAKELDKTVIVEGVETDAQCRYLMEMGCCNIQGFYFSKPLSKDEFNRTAFDKEVKENAQKNFVLF